MFFKRRDFESHGYGRHGGLMISAVDSEASGPGPSPWPGTLFCVLGQDTYGASLHHGVLMDIGEFNVGGNGNPATH